MSTSGSEPSPRTDASARAAALSDLRHARRRNRLADVHWSDSIYRFYVVIVSVGILLLWARGQFADNHAGPSAMVRVRAEASAIVGMIVGALLAGALRSGSRGGPLAIEAADVMHVLQAPVERSLAFRRPMVHQLRRGVLMGASVGLVSGLLAERFLAGSAGSWAIVGAAAGGLLGLSAISVSVAVSALGISRPVASAGALLLLIWSGFDIAQKTRTAPQTFIAAAFLSPIERLTPSPGIGWAALVALAVLSTVLAWSRLASTPLEAVERRSRLVDQLRFAVSTQDLRTSLLLRRQLSSERSRTRPLFRVPSSSGPTGAVVVRGLRGLARWPTSRILRVVLLSVLAGGLGVVAWEGVLPLAALSGLCFFVIGLDATESLAQDADHPDLSGSFPRHLGRVANRQVIVAFAVLAIAAVISALSIVVVGVLRDAPESAGTLFLLGLYLSLVAGTIAAAMAALTIVMGPPSFTMMLQTPEMALGRTALAPGLAVAGAVLPMLLVRWSANNDKQPSVIPGMFQAAAMTTLLVYFVLMYLTSSGSGSAERR